MVPSVEKKIAELEMGLLHLQQNIDIPEISLAIHPVVTAMVKKTAEEGRRPKVQDFGDKVEDSTFLNQLQNGVNRWIREIQKVCNIDSLPLKFAKHKNSGKITNFILQNIEKLMVPCKSTADEVSFEWSHHRILLTVLKVRTTCTL